MAGRRAWRAGEGQGRLPWGRPEPAARSLRESAVGSPPRRLDCQAPRWGTGRDPLAETRNHLLQPALLA